MKLGAFMMPVHPAGKNYVQTLREDREAVILADELGFSEFFIGEHTTDLIENIPSNLAFIASLAYATKNIKLATGTVNLPNSHPANVAATAAMIDNMLEGRFIFGISPGGLPSDWEIFETLEKDRNAMFVECIEHILALWGTQAPYDLKGQFWNISTKRFYDPEVGIGSLVSPYQGRTPEIACTALLPFSPGIEKAAARGWHPVSANFLQPSPVASHWHQYTKGCQSAGLLARREDWRIARNIFIADNEETARRYGLGEDGPYAFYVKQLYRKLKKGGKLSIFKNSPEDPDELITYEYVKNRLLYVGTVNSVVDQILAFRESTGDFGTLLYAITDWFDPILSRRSMELMATEVMPLVNSAIDAERRMSEAL